MQNNIFSIVVTFNPDEFFGERLSLIAKQVDKLIVYDNSEHEDSIQFVKSICHGLAVEYKGDGCNHGIGEALNYGAYYAVRNNFKYYLTFDQDSKIPSSYSELLVSAITTDEKIAMVGPVYIDVNDGRASRFPVKKVVGVKRQVFNKNDVMSDVMCIITSGALCKVNVFKKIGFFRDDYFIDYVDNEFCLRLLKNGFRVCVLPNLAIEHALGNRTKVNLFSPTNYPFYRKYYITRNRIDVWGKYFIKYPFFVFYDILAFFLDLFRVIFFESSKILKIKSMIIGVKDYFCGNMGRWDSKS